MGQMCSFLAFFVFACFFRDRVSLCSTSWLQTHRDLPISGCWDLASYALLSCSNLTKNLGFQQLSCYYILVRYTKAKKTQRGHSSIFAAFLFDSFTGSPHLTREFLGTFCRGGEGGQFSLLRLTPVSVTGVVEITEHTWLS